MSFRLYDHVDAKGVNQIKCWIVKLQVPHRAKLNNRLRMLQQLGDELLPQVLSPTDTPGILKLRVKSNVQLRPMLCRGPVEPGAEYTLLLGAIEKGGKLQPKDADEIADRIKVEVASDPENRREEHE